MFGQYRHRRRRRVKEKTFNRFNIECRLSDLFKGEYAEVIFNNAKGQVRRRLMDMGVIKGAKFKVVRKAPLGDPIEIELDGFYLSSR